MTDVSPVTALPAPRSAPPEPPPTQPIAGDEPAPSWTADEVMTIAAARSLRDGQACFVGIGLPSTAANLARRLHAPHLVLIYESGTLDSRPAELPLSIGDGILADSALTVVSVPEIFNYWLQPGRIDVGFLSGAQIDRYGNINTTVIGSYDEPAVRLPGSGGAPEIASSCREVIVVMRHQLRAFVEQVDFVTSVGQRHRPRRPRAARAARRRPGAGDHRSRCAGTGSGDGRAGAHRAAPGRHRGAGQGRDRMDPAGLGGPGRHRRPRPPRSWRRCAGMRTVGSRHDRVGDAAPRRVRAGGRPGAGAVRIAGLHAGHVARRSWRRWASASG